MAKKIKAIDLSKILKETLDEYSDEVVDKVNKQIPDIAKSTVPLIENKAPVRTGDYKKSWDYTINQKDRFTITATIYSNMPQLPHLLEFGHANRGGGRTEGKPHIEPAEKQAVAEIEKKIEEAINNVAID